MADPGFPQKKGPQPGGGGGAKLLFGIIFAENYMRMKQMDRVKYHKHIDIDYIEPNSSCDLGVGYIHRQLSSSKFPIYTNLSMTMSHGRFIFMSYVILYTLNPVH